ncbi:AMP-dependent synthetase/ligase domain-containing protein [Strongyloides ratti]|uniref:long-chain-fatty-acid--CoA ligase n=1 Tax=Strongyloides ratti TaxID=34506 RepID=A0A090MXE2_STRRB|nr:AMP-dependent synthetase/ligase domain-containing protein [Strongyloides ratti]CEF65279.1 AMP-dependent synthetase/ligase domain-containing protein [Strongyloides ratti]
MFNYIKKELRRKDFRKTLNYLQRNSQHSSGVIVQPISKNVLQDITSNKIDKKEQKKLIDVDIRVLAVKALFMISDIITYLPNKISGAGIDCIEKSNAIKAVPLISGDPSSPWVNIKIFGSDLEIAPFEGCKNLYQIWENAVAQNIDKEIIGVREVLGLYKIPGQPSKLDLGEYICRKFREAGMKKGDRVVIFSETRKEWLITALTSFKEGLPLVTIYSTLGEDAVAHAVNETNGKFLMTTVDQLEKLEKIKDKMPGLKKIICFDDRYSTHVFPIQEKLGNISVIEYDKFLTQNNNNIEIDIKPANVELKDHAIIMYTSGTTSTPKGVILTNENLIAAASGMSGYENLGGFLDEKTEVVACYLPLAHIFELTVELRCISHGIKIGYCSPQTLIDGAPRLYKYSLCDLKALKPTTMAVVPAVLNKMRSGVEDKLAGQPEWIQKIIDICYDRKSERYDKGLETPILDKILFSKFSEVLGGNIKKIVCGGAPLDVDTQRFTKMIFSKNVHLGYGLTETCAVTCLNHPYEREEGVVGPPLPCVEILLREWPEGKYYPSNKNPQGEILIHGGNVFDGYFNRDVSNDFAIINGKRYFCTGDIGEFTPNGNLKIIDRKKDLIKLAHGEYIALGKVESSLVSNPYIDNICLYAHSDMDYLIALIVANKFNIEKLAFKLNINGTFDELCKNKIIRNAVANDIAKSMFDILNKFEIPRKVILFSSPWTSQAGLLTDAMKIKRKAIEETFKNEIEEVYTPINNFVHHDHKYHGTIH